MINKINPILKKVTNLRIFSALNDGDKRSIKAKKHIFFSLIIRGGSAVVGFIMVPLILNFLGSEQYGVWMTLWTIIAWFGVLDLGFGNGLRNNFTIAKANNDDREVKTFVSSAYIGVILLSLILVFVFFVILPEIISWERILNSPAYLSTEIPDLVLIVFLFFIFTFITKLIGTILLADQRAAINNSIRPVANLLSLIIIFFIIKYNPDRKLIAIGTAISSTPFIIYFFYSIYYFNTDYRKYKPSFRFFKTDKLKSLMSLGIKFFIIQVSGIVILFTDNLIIAQLFGPNFVTPYSNANKLFFFVYMPVFATVLSTLWSAFTDAYARDDIPWINGVLRKLNKIWIFIALFTIILILFSKYLFRLWLGESAASDIPFSLSVLMGGFVIMYSWVNIYAYAINGIGKIKIMLYGNIIAAILNIPLSIFFGKYMHMGITGIILATIVTQIPFVIVLPLQVKKILNKTATGIWVK